MNLISRLLGATMVGVLITLQLTAVAVAAGTTTPAAPEPIVLPKPSFTYFVSPEVDSAAASKNTKKLAVTKKSVKKISVLNDYSESTEFESNEYEVPNPFRSIKGNLPKGIPTEYMGQMLVRAIKGKDNIILIYGVNFGENRYLVVMDKSLKKFLKAYDFVHYAYSPKYIKEDYEFIYQQTEWAVIEDGILYVSHNHNTYAKSSNGMNGYITAIRLSDNKVLWRTNSLVSNADNFKIVGNVIFSGYGFTNEKDYLFQIDKLTGKTLDQTLLKDGPSYMVNQDADLYVFGYAHLTQFQISN